MIRIKTFTLKKVSRRVDEGEMGFSDWVTKTTYESYKDFHKRITDFVEGIVGDVISVSFASDELAMVTYNDMSRKVEED